MASGTGRGNGYNGSLECWKSGLIEKVFHELSDNADQNTSVYGYHLHQGTLDKHGCRERAHLNSREWKKRQPKESGIRIRMEDVGSHSKTAESAHINESIYNV